MKRQASYFLTRNFSLNGLAVLLRFFFMNFNIGFRSYQISDSFFLKKYG